MKKLMIAAAIVCAAAFAQAASIAWNVTGVTAAPGGEALSEGNYYVYSFITSDSSGQNQVQTLDAVLAAFAAQQYPEEVLDGLAYAPISSAGTGAATLKNLNVAGAGAETPIVMETMAVIFDSWNPDPTDDSAPVMSKYQVVTGEVTFKMDDNITLPTAANNDWKSVPEPTSGLLLLLGVAGLALRRRRA